MINMARTKITPFAPWITRVPNGVDIKIVSEHLGHSDISTTGNIYADVLASSRQKTAEIIEFKLAN